MCEFNLFQFIATECSILSCENYEVILNACHQHYIKSVRIWSFSSRYFPAFGRNSKISRVNLQIQSECAKMQTRKTPNMDTFHAVRGYSKT